MMSLYVAVIFIVEVFLFAVIAVVAYFLFNGLLFVPWVSTSRELTGEMLRLAEVKPGDMVVDFGSGDGAIVIEAAKSFGAKGYGIERLSLLVWWSRWLAKRAGVSHKVKFEGGDMFAKIPPPADVITSYLFPEINKKLEPILLKHYASGTRVVARVFSFSGLKHIKSQDVGSDTIHLYEIP